MKTKRFYNAKQWDFVEGKFKSYAIRNHGYYLPEINLAVAVLGSAGRDDDTEYINSVNIETFCKLAALDPSFVRKMLTKTGQAIRGEITADFEYGELIE